MHYVAWVTKRTPLVHEIGARVKGMREGTGLTQRALARESGVSTRYLAQLEAGDANMSVERLAGLAQALGTTLAALVGARHESARPPELEPVRAQVDEILDGRDAGELREVRRWLEARFARRTAPVIALLGLRGAGKSTVGPKLAEKLSLRFVELDAEIERAAGLSLAEIFELHGDGYYRRLERETLMRLLAGPDGMVLATGGSLVNDRETYRLLRRRAVTVWLKARPEDHWNRVVQQGDQRPMARNPHAMAELRALLAARERFYSEAEVVVDTSKLPLDMVVKTLGEAIYPRASRG
jgi:XRE family aerobic/anaerobic benzoate catabolism transcriptional regulator